MSEFNPFTGQWSYRSFRNDPDLGVEPNDLLFGAGNLVLEETAPGIVSGTLGGQGWTLNLQGNASYGHPYMVRFQGVGEIGGETWVYDYLGFLSPHWPNGVDQRPAIVGTIVRTVPHSGGQATAGYVASWISVRQGA